LAKKLKAQLINADLISLRAQALAIRAQETGSVNEKMKEKLHYFGAKRYPRIHKKSTKELGGVDEEKG